MSKWEYRVIPLHEAAGVKKKSDGLRPERLNELGLQGWEAIGVTLKRAAGDAATTTAAIVHGTIRILGFATPIFAFLVLPVVLLTTAVVRRTRRAKSQWATGK